MPIWSSSFLEFITAVVCDQNNEDWMFGNCNTCLNKLQAVFTMNSDQKIFSATWYQCDATSQHMLKCQKKSIADCYAMLRQQARNFLTHTVVKCKQSAFFEDAKKSVSDTSIVIQLDFSEKYTFKQQKEIQIAHWANKQATLVTVYLWFANEKVMSIVFVSEYLDHDKYAVHKFLYWLMIMLKRDHQTVREVKIFSDCAASQFKQKFLFVNLTFREHTFEIKLSWHFFATSHGKRVVDGFGGTLKQLVWRECTSEKMIDTADGFAQIANEKSPKIKVIYLPAEEILEHKEELIDIGKEYYPCLTLNKLIV